MFVCDGEVYLDVFVVRPKRKILKSKFEIEK